MESLAAYIPLDRRQALANSEDLPNRMQGAALFADISGYTPLTATLVEELGSRRGVDELTQHINRVFEALITKVHRYGGSVISFGGDAITCWLNQDDGFRATACALAIQQAMAQFTQIQTPAGKTIPLTVKVAIATGSVRRFRIGDPTIQYLDVLAGKTLDQMAAAGETAQKGEIVVEREVAMQLSDKLVVAEWRSKKEDKDKMEDTVDQDFAVITGLIPSVEENLPLGFYELPNLSTTLSTTDDQGLTEAQIRPWLPPLVYKQIISNQGKFLADIRPVVALFMRFEGLDYEADDQAGEKLDSYIRWIQKVLTRYEGYLLKLIIGDKGSNLLASFGAPLAHDDDASRAVAAALELRSLSSQFEFIQSVQIGISQGRMLAGAFGSTTRWSYDLLGNEANMAARLMMKAKSGQILASQRVATAASRNHRFNSLGSVEIKGRQDPLPIFEVTTGRSFFVPTFTSRLVGREVELTQMAQLLEEALTGQGQFLQLEGLAGVGKSHLTVKFIQQALQRGFRVALGTCDSTSHEILYYPWRQIFRTLFDLTDAPFSEERTSLAAQLAQVETQLSTMNPDWLTRLPLLGDLLDLPVSDDTTTVLEPRQRQEATFAFAVEIIKNRAHHHPLLLVIEDAHWMDEASSGLTLSLSRNLMDTPVLLILVRRPPITAGAKEPFWDELNRLPNYYSLILQELPLPEIAALIADRLQGELSPLALSVIQARAQGNPFYTEELVTTLREMGRLYYHSGDKSWWLAEAMVNVLREANCLTKDISNGQWILAPDAPLSTLNLDLPDSVNELIFSRFDRLPEGLRLTLKAASVIGRTFEFEVLAHAHPAKSDPKTLLEQMEALADHDFVHLERLAPRRIYTFKHHLTQEVVYQSMLEVQQRRLHQAIGQALEQSLPGAVERLAYHYTHSDVRDKAWFYLDKAAHKTQREFANETALNYFNQALALEERWPWRKGQVEVLHILGRRDEERAGLERLEAMLNKLQSESLFNEGGVISVRSNFSATFEVAYLWSQYYEAIGDYAQAQVVVERALATSQAQSNELGEARCLAQLGLITRRQGDYERAKTWYDQARSLFQP